MPSVLEAFRPNLKFAFLGVGAVWLALVYLTASVQLLWAVAVFWIAGLLLAWRPGWSFSRSWSAGAGVMGLFLSLYQVYIAAPLVAGAFASIAAESVVAFVVFALVHIVMLFSLMPKKS
jgi:hypothetical protein